MKKEYEIEGKFSALSSDRLLLVLKNAGFERKSVEHQEDIYFVDHEQKFLSNRTCLRIRKDLHNHLATLDYKGPSTPEDQDRISKIESNGKLDFSSIDVLIDIFAALGFTVFVKVVKERENWVQDDGSFRKTVAIDRVVDAGEFVEVEVTTTDLSDQEGAQHRWDNLVSDLRDYLGESVNTPYRDLVALGSGLSNGEV